MSGWKQTGRQISHRGGGWGPTVFSGTRCTVLGQSGKLGVRDHLQETDPGKGKEGCKHRAGNAYQRGDNLTAPSRAKRLARASTAERISKDDGNLDKIDKVPANQTEGPAYAAAARGNLNRNELKQRSALKSKLPPLAPAQAWERACGRRSRAALGATELRPRGQRRAGASSDPPAAAGSPFPGARPLGPSRRRFPKPRHLLSGLCGAQLFLAVLVTRSPLEVLPRSTNIFPYFLGQVLCLQPWQSALVEQ